MKIVEYQHLDPLEVLHLNLLALDVELTEDLAASKLRSDPRLAPYLAIYAEEDGKALGQVGVFRLPMASLHGKEDVGGTWGLAVHPAFSERGIAGLLLDEAHTRMRADGLRFSMVNTDRSRLVYGLYQKHGYQEMPVWASALADWNTAHQPTRLRATPTGRNDTPLVEAFFASNASAYTGFSWQFSPFPPLQHLRPHLPWFIWLEKDLVGYAFLHEVGKVLKFDDLFLRSGINPVESVSAVITAFKNPYVMVRISRPQEMIDFRKAGYLVAFPDSKAFMVKPLTSHVSIEDFSHLFRIGTNRFLISWRDLAGL